LLIDVVAVHERFSQETLPKTFWEDENNRRNYWMFLKTQLGGTFDHLYDLSPIHFMQTGGMSLNDSQPLIL